MQHQRHCINVAEEHGVGNGTCLLVVDNTVAKIEIEVALCDSGSENLAVAGVDIATSGWVRVKTRLAPQTAGTPFVTMHPWDIRHSGEDSDTATQREQQVQGNHALRHPPIFLVFFH